MKRSLQSFRMVVEDGSNRFPLQDFLNISRLAGSAYDSIASG